MKIFFKDESKDHFYTAHYDEDRRLAKIEGPHGNGFELNGLEYGYKIEDLLRSPDIKVYDTVEEWRDNFTLYDLVATGRAEGIFESDRIIQNERGFLGLEIFAGSDVTGPVYENIPLYPYTHIRFDGVETEAAKVLPVALFEENTLKEKAQFQSFVGMKFENPASYLEIYSYDHGTEKAYDMGTFTTRWYGGPTSYIENTFTPKQLLESHSLDFPELEKFLNDRNLDTKKSEVEKWAHDMAQHEPEGWQPFIEEKQQVMNMLPHKDEQVMKIYYRNEIDEMNVFYCMATYGDDHRFTRIEFPDGTNCYDEGYSGPSTIAELYANPKNTVYETESEWRNLCAAEWNALSGLSIEVLLDQDEKRLLNEQQRKEESLDSVRADNEIDLDKERSRENLGFKDDMTPDQKKTSMGDRLAAAKVEAENRNANSKPDRAINEQEREAI